MVDFDKLPKKVQAMIRKEQKIRVPIVPVAEISRHALAIAAILRDARGLKSKDARRVLTKALTLV